MKPVVALILSTAALLAACGEKPQTAGTMPRADTRASTGTDNGFAAPGWKAGDDAAWQAQLRTRAQGQNEYARSPAAPKTP